MRSSAVALSLPVLLGSFSAARPTRSTAAPTHGCAALAPGNAPRAVANDNRRRAGRWRGDTLVVSLVASRVAWYPEAEDGCALPVLAFAEAGRAASVPGPLLRVRAGTQLRVAVRNGTGRALWLRGFNDHPAATRAGVELAPDSTREFRFVAKAPGTYAYGATLAPYPEGGATVRPVRDDSQLLGAFVVDNAQSSGTRDRVLVITRWTIRDPGDSTRPPLFYVSAVNGKSWPYTERLAYGVGDSIRWRVVNGSLAAHPMHLHGFYFDVLARGTFARDTVLARPRTVVTEPLPVGQTMELRWRAERPGNWLFHCHLLAHMSAVQRLDRMSDSALHTLGVAAAGAAPGTASPMAMGAMSPAMEDMAGLIVGVQIRPHAPTSRTALPQPPRRTLHLFADQRADVFGPGVTGYGFVLQEGASAPAPDSIRRPGSTLVLRRGEPVRIVVVNRLTMPLSVHWHGLELESFFDGVGGWSGAAASIAPPIAPGDSFVVRLTPPRAGTFMYHVHGEDGMQLAAGLYGPIVVLDGAARLDTLADQTILVSDARPTRPSSPLVNGSARPPLHLVAGRATRLRIIGITSNASQELVLLRGADTVRWRLLARDGASLPGAPEPLTAAAHRFGPGMIADYELLPTEPGELTMRLTRRGLEGRLLDSLVVPIAVLPPGPVLGGRRLSSARAP